MEDYSKYSAEELESMLGEYDAASKSAQTPESTATVMKPQGIKQRKVDLGEFLKLGQENKSGSSLDDLYGDGAASELIGTYAAITPFSGTAASMNANRAIRQLQDSIKTGEVPFTDVKGADTVGGFVKAFIPFTKGVVGKAADEWDAKEGAKYDLYERAANGEDVDASSLVKRVMGNDGRYRPIVDEDGNVQLDEKYAGGKDAKDAARKEFVKGFSSRMLEQYAVTMDAAEKERASDVSPWYSLMVKYGAEQIPFTTEMFMGSSAMRAASASGRLGSTAQTIAEALNNGEKVANVSRTARAAYKLGELSVPAIIGAADRYERLRANDVTFDENGDMVIKDNARGVAEATAMAAAGGLTNVILEEYTNKAVGGLLKWTGGKAARFPGIGPKFVEFFKKHGGDKAKNYVLDFMKGYEKIAQRTKFGLPVGEFTEEYVQDIADKVVGLDAKEGERKSFMDFSGDFFTWDSNLKELTLGILGMTLLQGGGAHFMERGNRVVKSFDGRVTGTLKAAGIDGSMMSPSHRIAAAIQVNPDLNKELDFSLDEVMRMNGVTWSEIDKMTPQEKRAAMSVMGQVYANGGAEELAKRLDKTMQGVVNDMDAQALLDGNWRNVESAKNRQSRATWVTVADKAGNIIWNTDEETGKKYVQDAAVGARIYDNGDGTFRAYHPEIGFTKSFNEMADAADWISAMDKAAQERAEIRDKKKQYVQTIAERIAPERKDKDGKTYGANVVAYNTMEDALNDDCVSDADKNEIAKVMSKGGASGVMLSDGRVAVFVDEMKTIGDALYTVIHELGHVGLREGTKGNAKGASLAQTIENAWRGTSAYKTPNADSEQKEEDVVENNERAIAHANPVRRAVAAVKQFVNENLGGKLELTDNDYNAIVESGVRRIEKRGGMENTPSNFFNTKKELGDVAFVRTEEGNKMVALKEKSAWISDYRAQKEALDAARAEIDYIKAQTDRAEEENRQAKKDEANAEWMEKEIERREEAKRREEEEKRQIADAEHATKYGRQMVADALEGWYGVGSYGKNGIKPEQINRIVKGATDEEISELLDFLEIEAGGKASDGTFLEAAKNVNLAIARRTVSEKQEANRKNLANRAKTESADRKTAERKLVEKFVNDVQMNTNSILAFWLNNGKKLLNHPQAKLIANKGRGKGFRYVFSGKEVDSEALNAFFDGKHGEERAKWKRIVFGENYKPAKDGDVVGNDVKNGDWIEFKHGASGFDKYNDAEGIMSDEDFNDFGSMLEQLRKEYSEYEEWKNGDQLTAEEQRIKDEIERENKRIDEENAEIDSAREAWDGAIAMTSDGKPISSPSEMKVGDVTTIGNAAEGELRLEVIGRDGDVIQFACNDNPMFEGEVFSLKWNNEKGDWDEVQQKADEGGQDRDRREVAGDAEQDGSSGREEGRGNGSGDGAEAGGRAATEEARNADDANALKLESATAADIAAENKRIADRAEISRRQSAPLKGGSMEVGQTLMDLGGAEGEDLFNRTMFRSKYGISEDTHRKLGKAGEVLLDAALSKGTFETRWRKVIDNGFKEKTEDEIVRELRADKFNDGETRKVGAQSIVYRQGDKVVKLRDVDGDVVDALRKIEQFNDLFPDMKYEVRMESVKDNGGKTRIVIEQPYVDALPNSGTEARKQLVEQLKERFGSENVTTRGDVNEKKLLSPKSWFSVEAGPWKISDLKDLNLGIDKNDGKVKVWDAEIEYDENEAKPKKTLFRRNSPVTPEEDAAYMDAVKRGDMETARRMVREAAAKAMPDTKVVDKDGLPFVVYHNTDTNIKSFIVPWEGPIEWDGLPGVFFADKPQSQYGHISIPVFLDLKNPRNMNDGENGYIHGRSKSAIDNFSEEYEKAIGKYTDDFKFNDDGSLEITNRGLSGMKYDGYFGKHPGGVIEYAALSPSQVKSADPVTYDDAGNVIPLSERFNLEKSDIRWRRNRPYSPNVNAQRLADVYKLTSAESRAYVKMQRMLGADDYQSLVKAVREVQIQGSVNAENKGLLDAINNGDKTKVLDDLKRGTESVIVRNGKKFLKIKLQDAMTSVKQMEDALGVKKEDSVYYQFDRNYGLEQEHLDALNREVMVPLRDEMAALEKKHNRKIKSHKIVTKNGVATQQEEYHEETAYGLLNMLLMAKHGPNRNRMMAERSPYVLEAMTNKATKQIIDDVLNGVRDLDEATVKQIAANLGWSGEKLTRLEKGLSGSGASTAFWNKWMKDHAQFAADADKARRLILKMNQMTRDVLVKSGRMSAAQAKEWERLSPDYVPLRSDMDVDSSIFAKLFLGGNGSGVASGAEGHKYTDNEFHHAFGRNDIADDAIAFSQQQYMEAVKRALDNDARRKLAATVRKNPNLGNVIMLLSEAERADIAKRVAILKNTFQKRGLTPQELDALVKMTRKLAEDRIGQGFIPTQRILGANGVYYDIPNVKGLERNEKNKNDTRTPFIAFKEDGELKFIMLGGFSQREINANPALLSDSDAKEIATQVKKQNLFRSNFASGLRKWTGWFSAMRTAYSPYFIATNLLADRSQAKRNIDATFGSEGVKKFRHYAFNSFGAARAVLDYKKIVDPATGETRYERVFDNNSNVQKYAKEWAENGGRIAGMAIENIRELRDGIRYNIRNAGSVKDRWNRTDVKDPKSMLAFLNDMRVRGSDVVEYANSVVEMSTRIAAYATARDMGMSIADAVSYSRDVTVNFNRKGELTPFINAWWAFSNASIQDFSRSMEAFGEGEYVKGSLILGKRGAKMALKLAIWGFLASLVGIGQDDPEDEAEGEKQYKYNKEWEKANKMGVRIGDFTVGVPIRGLSRVPYYFGQKMAEVMFTNKRTTSAALDVAKLVFDTGYDVVGGSPTLAQAISPSVMKPLVELWENKDFTGKQIYTEDVFGKGFAKSEMGRSSTSDEAKAVARFVNWITGGDRGKSGKIDLHPEVYEKLLDWAGGTAMRDVAQTAGFVKDLATFNIANRNVRNMPLVSRFIRSVGENSSDFYEKRAEYDKAKTHHAKMADIGDAESMREDENEMPWLSKRGSGKRWGDALKDKESEIKKLLKAEKTLEGEDKELAHKLRLKSQYQFMRRLETAPKYDAEGVKAERDHKRAAMPLIRKATKMLEDAERKRKRLERGL